MTSRIVLLVVCSLVALLAQSVFPPAANSADTAKSLAANGSNCSASNFPLGVDASGAVENCTALLTFGVVPWTAPPTSSWTWDNQDAATSDTTSGASIYVELPQENSALRMQYRTAPATPYTITGVFSTDFASSAADGNALSFGFRDSGGKYVAWHIATNGNIYSMKWTSATAVSAAYSTVASTLWTSNPKYLQITDNGTNLIFRYRLSQVDNWVTFDTRSRTDFMAGGPNAVAWGGYVHGGIARITLTNWVQE